ncbi:MAG: hypothetical protein IPF51_16240 [Dehalococcoidia bacterium]|uniref:hypothetical protein n=1 Tax=Candidatus Amarobacter glycogenicus TaxID=3140699 RepID=UPI0031351682|nr:hypothetical protein [Dehalococcoidia bacterium]
MSPWNQFSVNGGHGADFKSNGTHESYLQGFEGFVHSPCSRETKRVINVSHTISLPGGFLGGLV